MLFKWNIRSFRTEILVEYPVMSTSQGTYVQIEQTPEVMRETYKCAEWGGGEGAGIENRWVNYSIPFQNTLPQRRLWSRLLFAEYCQSKASRFHWDLNSDRWIQSPEC